VAYIWHWYLDISGYGRVPVTYSEIRAWAQVTGTPVTGEEAKALRTLDIINNS